MKYLALLLALCSEMAWSQLQAGTVIFLDFEKDEITMSADSNLRSANTGEIVKDCKISTFGNKFAFQIAGLIKDAIPNGWDVRRIARQIWQSESAHESDASK